MPNQIFNPEHKSINDIFVRDVQYIIPPYQRPYSWESLGKSDTNNQINRMWDDFYEFYSENDQNQEYFFGSIVVYKDSDGSFQVVDGQQRLTSLLLLFASMKCFLLSCKKKLNTEEKDELEKFLDKSATTIDATLYNEEDIDLSPTLKVKIVRTGQYDFDQTLNQSVSCKEKSVLSHQQEGRNKLIAERYFNTSITEII